MFQFIFYSSCLLLLYFWLLIFSNLVRWRESTGDSSEEEAAVSVVIAAHNEEAALQNNIPDLLAQNYPSFEVIVTDDHSTDGTSKILERVHRQDSRLLFSLNSPGHKGKKSALAQSISNSNHSIILTTDADCSPVSENWIRSMEKHISGEKEIVLGYGPCNKDAGWLNAFIRFETVMTAIQYFSYALTGKPYMGVGRNLMYSKALFKRVGGFTSHEGLMSGDDDLFINQVASPSNVAITLDPDSFVYSEAKKTWKEFLVQKARHLSTGKSYKKSHQWMLGIFGAAQMMFYPLGLFFLLSGKLTAGLVFILVLLTKWMIFNSISKRLNENDLSIRFPVLDCWFCIYLWWMAPSALWRKPEKWK